MHSMTRTTALPTPRAGLIDDIEDDDNGRGYERDETDSLHRYVRRLVADGDRRAGLGGRRARRTLSEMVPDRGRRPALAGRRLVAAAEDACPICGYWRCHCVRGGSDVLVEQHR